MPNFRDSVPVVFKASFFIFLAGCILLFPLNWILAWYIAALVHECSHCISLYACGCRINRICIGATGATIETGPIKLWQELICALAGPVGGLFLLLFVRQFPLLAIFALIQTCTNLIPMHGRDGGRAVRCILLKLFGNYCGEKLSDILDCGVKILLIMTTVALCVYLKCYMLIAAFVVFWFIKGKFPCKPGKQIVQYRQLIPKRS